MRAAEGEGVVALDAAQVRARCDSPLFTGGLEVDGRGDGAAGAARLRAARARLLDRGVRIHEHSRVRGARRRRRGDRHGPRARPARRSSRIGPASGALQPLRNRPDGRPRATSSCTEPVPDVVEALGWTGGEAISDGRTLLHYLRTTPDGRILFGWAGGRMAMGARTGGRMEVDPEVIARAKADLVRFFPALAGRTVERAWGGPIDVSPTHLPFVMHAARRPRARRVRLHRQRRRALAPRRPRARRARPRADRRRRRAADRPARRRRSRPSRSASSARRRSAARSSPRRRPSRTGGRPSPVARALAGVPARMGMHIVR